MSSEFRREKAAENIDPLPASSGALPTRPTATMAEPEAILIDKAKSDALKARLADQPEPQTVSIADFFDGNDDEASIGCNVLPHPGIPAFRRILETVAARPDVEAVWVEVSELDPGEDYWPFAETVFIAGSISVSHLRSLVEPLQPDVVDEANAAGFLIPPAIKANHARILIVWWD